MPLDRAKITQGAAVRKLKKAKKKAVKAAEAATESRTKAEGDLATAEGMLNVEMKKATGGGQGELWFMKRELDEAKKELDEAKNSDEELDKAKKSDEELDEAKKSDEE